jgi:transposase
MTQRGKRRKRVSVNKVTTGFRVSDEVWAVLEPVLPRHVNTHRFGGGKPRTPARQCAAAIFYVLRTGCQWKAVDATELCPHSTAHDRFQEWGAAGVFRQLGKAGVDQVDDLKGLDWRGLSRDGAMSKAPLGGGKNRAQSPGSSQTGRQTERTDRGPRGTPWRGRRGGQSA